LSACAFAETLLVALDQVNVSACPNCGNECPVISGYATWCEACDWNVSPPTPERQSKTRGKVNRWMDASVLPEASRGSAHRGFRVATYAYATFIYLVVIALFLGGVAVLWASFPNFFGILLAILMIGIAWIAFPRFPKVPPGVIDRSKFPALCGLVDRVAHDLGAHTVDDIVINNQFNAFFATCGIRGRRVLGLGLPLMSALDAQELVALIAHEMAHDVNRDPIRGRYTGGAYIALQEMHGMLRTDGFRIRGRGGFRAAEVAAASAFTRLSMRLLAVVTRPFVFVFEVLIRRDSQAAEYRADTLSAEVAGAPAAYGVLRMLHLRSLLDSVAGGLVASRGDATTLFERFREKIAVLPQREWQRLERYMQLEQTQLDSTHPPTAERMRVIGNVDDHEPRVTVEPDEWQTIRRELQPLEAPFGRAYVDRSRDRLYR
jgi:Zn-dependent protease with chaperone function